MAGLPASSAIVYIGPPLLPSESSMGSVSEMFPVPPNGQLPSPSRLCPPPIVPATEQSSLSSPWPATIVLVIVVLLVMGRL